MARVECIKAGTPFESTAEFRTAQTDELVDPPHVKVTLRRPDGTLLTFVHPSGSINHPETGCYELNFIPEQVGMWWISWRAEGDSDSVYIVREHPVMVQRRTIT